MLITQSYIAFVNSITLKDVTTQGQNLLFLFLGNLIKQFSKLYCRSRRTGLSETRLDKSSCEFKSQFPKNFRNAWVIRTYNWWIQWTNVLIGQLIMCIFSGMFQRCSYEDLVGYKYLKHFSTNKNWNMLTEWCLHLIALTKFVTWVYFCYADSIIYSTWYFVR